MTSWGSGLVEAGNIVDVPVETAWARLKDDPETLLIDVRTRAEWSFVGVPDLNRLGKKVVTMEWQSFPDGLVDRAFPERLGALLEGAGVAKDTELFFICRSGARSRMAAEALAAVGYTRCRNVAEGFEGPLDPDRHRGRIAGWKAAGLPWMQG